ncbi:MULTISPECIES: DUF1842 domain-containing protein [Pseudomonas]|uniref:DUF1842 domain-containing protein n=2 Tax=Pseudomonas chlororaphis TaxID=587753 RepID=A0AAD0ZFA5_9PSED|nr:MULTISPECIES: DUF1842 domain-containing protein [Pseudomonas]AZD21424.1 hypothetical protein C4K24_2121 [Pseudomonas chlororaphis subsp. aurantiaca]AZD53975.1 hypothetical protein C4K19_2188 [Pseudomonas chlororaphis subsp. aurantiaca]AZD60069.1 hypothetical protein C4K18_2096 [Pseudomonas chlororaphis subsp. aurantiaca]AZD78712.1 hypothetical protein C4K15_2145 [Pseudomonas chlororaphis subsp. aurantiaca]AZD85135.1 hypothetical protein C4K14_2311 [Pseudomonas chlororaphis subsp. aureofacie
MSGSTTSPVGLFPLSYRIGNPTPGAPSLTLDLLVYTPEQTVRGTSVVTQATNPPLDLQSDVWGQYTYLTVMPPSSSKILVTAQGNQGGPGSNSIVTFKIQLVVDHDWKNGIANYQYYNGQRWVSVENAPAHLVESVPSYALSALPIPLEPGPVLLPYPPITPLYAAPIHGAIASGDLTQMKSLASLAQQQLDQLPQLRSALDAAKDEIGRLERR